MSVSNTADLIPDQQRSRAVVLSTLQALPPSADFALYHLVQPQKPAPTVLTTGLHQILFRLHPRRGKCLPRTSLLSNRLNRLHSTRGPRPWPSPSRPPRRPSGSQSSQSCCSSARPPPCSSTHQLGPSAVLGHFALVYLPTCVFRQQEKHKEIPAPVLPSAHALRRVAMRLDSVLNAAVYTEDLLFGSYPAWTPGQILPRRRDKQTRRQLQKNLIYPPHWR